VNEPNSIDINWKYLPLIENDGLPNISTRYLIMTGGRAPGKSFALSTALCLWAGYPGFRILFTRHTLVSAKDSIIPEFSEKIDLLGQTGAFYTANNSVRNLATESEILFRGIKTSQGTQTAKLKSLQGINVWVLDEADEMPDEDTFDKIDLSVRDSRRQNLIILILNPLHKAHWIFNRFFKNKMPDGGDIPDEFCGVVGNVTYIHTTYEDNIQNLPDGYLHLANDCKLVNPAKYQHIWRGHWTDQVEGALWSWEMINPYRVKAAPRLRRIVIPIDPAVTSKAASAETGIIPVGMGYDGHFYVLADCTCRESPMQWAKRAIAAYHRFKADRVIGEVNNGGDLVETTLRSVDRRIPYKAVRASRGKLVRAEPIAALYEQGLVHHVSTLTKLEGELITYTGDPNELSPNRLDSLVWGLAELSGTGPGSSIVGL